MNYEQKLKRMGEIAERVKKIRREAERLADRMSVLRKESEDLAEEARQLAGEDAV